jgi:biopolymer transport protein ExbD
VYVARKPVARIAERDPAREVRLPDLATAVRKYREALETARYRIDPDPAVPHGHVVAVLDTLMEENIGEIVFVAPAERRR